MARVVQVTAPYVIVRAEDGATQHEFYQDAVLPSGLDGDHVKMLLDDGMVSEVDLSTPDDGESDDDKSDDGDNKPAAKKAAVKKQV